MTSKLLAGRVGVGYVRASTVPIGCTDWYAYRCSAAVLRTLPRTGSWLRLPEDCMLPFSVITIWGRTCTYFWHFLPRFMYNSTAARAAHTTGTAHVTKWKHDHYNLRYRRTDLSSANRILQIYARETSCMVQLRPGAVELSLSCS